MAKTIEQRAEEFAEKYSYTNTSQNVDMKCGYIKGATDQHKIDIEKACEWIRRNTEQRTDSYGSIWVESNRYETQEEFIERFKQAMEEEQ